MGLETKVATSIPDLTGDILSTWGVVQSVASFSKVGVIVCDIGLRDQNENAVCVGEATVVLPFAEGISVPYPFNPTKLGLIQE